MATKPSNTLYRTIWRWHFYAGLFCIPFVLTLAISGAIYLFKPQIESWLDRPYQNLQVKGERANPNDQIAAAINAVTDSRFVSYRLPQTDHQAVVITVNQRNNLQQVYLNPYTLDTLKISAVDNQFIQLVRTFHGELLAGTFGSLLVELAGCWAMVLLITGLYLWWPRSAQGLGGIVYPRLNQGSRIFWRDIHAVVGLWISAFALFLLITGMPWALVWGSTFKELRQLGNQQEPAQHAAHAQHAEHQQQHQQHQQQDWSVSRADEKSRMIAVSGNDVNLTNALLQSAHLLAFVPPVELTVSPENGNVWMVKSQPQNRTLGADAQLDSHSGEVIDIKTFAEKSNVDKIIGIGIAAHEGQLFGWFNQLLGVLTALGLVLMSISGFVLWRKRKPVGKLGAPPALPDARVGKVVAVIVLSLACLLPMLAISLVALLLIEWLVLTRFRSTRAWLGIGAE